MLKTISRIFTPLQRSTLFVRCYSQSSPENSQGIEISKHYMIGDNPDSDIDGANRRGDNWVSILVRTGVFQGVGNSEKHPAKYVVEDMEEAVKLIFELEKLDFKL